MECAMNCYLPWNLKDMTNISAEKLQKNISRQTSYIELYRTELMKETLRFNVASLLRHVCMNRSVFGSDDLSKKATDCLVVFLHATAFLKAAYFTPTDVENPAVPKCCRNLHRLMLENVKATMRYIDYTVLLRYAMGDVTMNGMYTLREQLHTDVFPDDDLFDVCSKESINDDFYRLVDQETSKAGSFIDFDVQRNTGFDTAFCMMFSKMPRQEEELPESEFGIIGASKQTLDKPFIRYGNSFYSFVTAYSFKNISKTLETILVPSDETEPEVIETPVTEAPVATPVGEEEVVNVEDEEIITAEELYEDEESPIQEPEETSVEEEPLEEPMSFPPQEESAETPVEEEPLEAEPSAEEPIDEEPVSEQEEVVESPIADEEPVVEEVFETEPEAEQEPEIEESLDAEAEPASEPQPEAEPIEEPEPIVEEVSEEVAPEPMTEPETTTSVEVEEVMKNDEIYESDAEVEDSVDAEQKPVPMTEHRQTEDSIYKEHEIDDDEYEIPETEEEPEESTVSSFPEEEVEVEEEPAMEAVEETVAPAPTENAPVSENIKEFIERHDPQQIILPNQLKRTDRMDDIFDDDDFEEIFTEEQENRDNDSAYIETDEYEYPDEFEEDDSNSQEELERIAHDVYELAEEDQLDEEPKEEPATEEQAQPSEAEAEKEENYSALVSDDTYRYLDEADPSEFEKDEMLEEQEILEDLDEYEDEEPEENHQEEEDPYSGESLFSLADDDVEDNASDSPSEPAVAPEPASEPEPVAEEAPAESEPETENEPIEEEPVVEEPAEEAMSFPPQEEPEETPVEEKQEEVVEAPVEKAQPVTEEPAPEPENEPVTDETPEPDPVAEPEPQPEPEPEPVVEEPKPAEPDVLPLLDHILKFSPSRNNPITIYLMGCQFQQQKDLVSFIERARKSWLIDGKDKMFTIPDTEISIAIFSETQDPMVNIQRRENIGAVMYAMHKDSWNSLELSFDTSGQMVKANYNRVSRMSFSDWEWRIVEKLGNRILERKGK